MSTPMLAALEALVRVESPTEDLDACRDVVRLASDIATRVTGTPAQIIEHNGRPVFWWGAQEPEIVLLAHLDTVWPKGSFEPIWEIKGDVLRGPGTFDMKAGFIQALFAIKDIKGSVALIGTTDEETGIQANGKIDFPIIGDIYLKGKTLRESKAYIEEAIKPILKISSVDVRLVGKTFSIIGAGKSGKFSFPKEKINIYQALAIAGDFSAFTDRSKIKILRVTEKGTQIKTFDIRSIDIINSEFYYIEPDDVIFLQPMNEQFFGATTLWSTISTIITSTSFLVGVYYLFVPKTK